MARGQTIQHPRQKRSDTCGHTKVVCEGAAISATRLPLQGRDCHKNRPQGEVRSLFTLISHSVGWNNNHSSSLYMPMHRGLKTMFKARWKTAWKGFKSVFPHAGSNSETSHVLIVIWLSRIKNLDQLNRWRKLYWWLILPPRTSL